MEIELKVAAFARMVMVCSFLLRVVFLLLLSAVVRFKFAPSVVVMRTYAHD
jgi:hypothetical protein